MTITCRQVSRVPEAQYTDRSFPSLIHSWEKRWFFPLNFSSSYRSRPKARTTRTAVRFSWAQVVRSPSASSAAWNRPEIFL